MLTAAVLGQRWAVPHPEVWNALILAFVLTAAVGDIRWRKIPRLMTTAAVAAGLIFHLVHGGLGWEFASALIATLIAFGVGLSFFQLGAIGGGDVKLITALGALLGLERWITAMEVAVIAAAPPATLAQESCAPANQAADPHETVTFSFSLRNVGTQPTSDLTATLLAGVLVGQIGITISPPLKATVFLMFLFAVGYAVGPQFVRGVAKDGPDEESRKHLFGPP